MRKTILQAFFVSIMFTLTAGVASAVTIPAGSGTLTYTEKETEVTCTSGDVGTSSYWSYQYSGFSYTASGVTTPLSSGDYYANSPAPKCDIAASWPNLGFMVTTSQAQTTIVFSTESDTATATVVALYQGYLNPRYLIMGVTYAPPGGNASSYASYGDTNFVGNTSTNTRSFSQNYIESVSVSEGTCDGSAGSLSGFQGGVCVTGSQSNAWTIVSNSTNTITMSKQTNTTLQTPGVPNAYSPVDHDYDIIWLWLNPVVTFTVPGTNTSSGGSITWTGYGYDYNDPVHEVDVWPVYVGTLNGDFGTSFDCGGVTEPIDCQDAGAFARSWVTTQEFASGQGPGITTADYPNILGADPFAANPGYLVTLESGTSPLTTTDGRFTQAGVDGVAPQTIPYKQAAPDSTVGENEMYQTTYVHTSTVGQGGSYTYEMGFGLEEKFGDSFFGLGVVYDFKQNWNFTWENTWQNTVTNTTTQQNTLSITGPPCPTPVSPCIPQYTEPAEFAAYQDNLYGTFMFWPNPYFSIGPVTPATQTVKAGGSTTYAVPTAANAGYSGTLTSFNVAGLPSGATARFSKSAGAPGFASTLTVSTTASTPAGTYPLTISATDGSLSYFACVAGCPSSEPYPTLVVSASPGFSIASSPSSDTIAVGGSATYTVTTTATNGFDGVVDLNVEGLPVDVSGGFSPETITGSGSSTLTINTTGNTPPGTYTLTITATSGSLTETATATLVVMGANFTLSATPEFQSIAPGGSAVYTVTATALSGFTGTVTLSLPGLPSGATATFSPTSISGGGGSSTLTIITTTSIAAEDYSLSVTGISGSITQTAPIDLDVE